MYELDVPSSHYLLSSFITDPRSAWSYIFIIVMLLLSAFFAGTETAFSYCNRHRLKVYADDGNKGAKLSLKIFEKFDMTLITSLIGTNIAHISLSAVTTVLAIGLLNNSPYSSIVSTLITTLLVFLFGDTIPKNIAKANSDKWCIISSFPIYGIMILFYPISLFFQGIIKLIRMIFKDKEDEDSFTEDDFVDVVEKVEEEGILDEEESDIIQNAVDFGDTTVREVYTKIDKVVALDIKQCKPEFLKAFLANNLYSRIPIYSGNINNIIGILHVRTYLRELFIHKKIDIKSVLLEPYFVSPSIMLDDIFDGFKTHKTHMAIIKTNNKTIGLVTMQDVLEELVGEINEKDTSNNKEVLH